MANEFMDAVALIDAGESVAKAISLITKNQNGSLVVTRNGSYYGIVDDRILRDFKGAPESAKVGKYAAKPAVLAKNSSAEQVVAAFLDNAFKVIPVVEKGKAVGVYSRAGTLNFVAGASAVKGKLVGDAATIPCRLVNQSASVTQCVNEMRKGGVHKLAVVDDEGFLQGLVTSFDVVTKVMPSLHKQFRDNMYPDKQGMMDKITVEKIMSTDVATIAAGTRLSDAVRKMIGQNKASMVVVKENKPVGVLSARNCFNACVVQVAPAITVGGLEKDEKALKESIIGEAAVLAEKLGKSLDVNSISLQVKSVQQGSKRRYQVRGKMTVNQQLLVAQTPNTSDSDSDSSSWDLHMAVKLVLSELKTQALKLKPSRKKTKAEPEEE
ncbi:CBS domain-containing protein [Candidatus Micrarchaeota archaeon]|nr:CBS domain-containing protein [Candidatus Micrarchaeota archaeon]